MHKTPPRTPADFMNIPSHIGPNGISPVKYEDSESEHESDPIELATPPKVIKLDDSNIWVNTTSVYRTKYNCNEFRFLNFRLTIHQSTMYEIREKNMIQP